jgi:hypothetical protein
MSCERRKRKSAPIPESYFNYQNEIDVLVRSVKRQEESKTEHPVLVPKVFV